MRAENELHVLARVRTSHAPATYLVKMVSSFATPFNTFLFVALLQFVLRPTNLGSIFAIIAFVNIGVSALASYEVSITLFPFPCHSQRAFDIL